MQGRLSINAKQNSPADSIGVVISKRDGSSPTVLNFSFILTQQEFRGVNSVRQGKYCVVNSQEGLVVAVIDQIHSDNQYFQNVQTVQNFDLANLNLQNYFLSDQWEYHIAEAIVLGVIHTTEPFSEALKPELFKKIDKSGFPVRPGNQVYMLEGIFLHKFLGLSDKGINIGELKHQRLDIKLDINRLFNKHLAILAQSGAGKSYLISVLLECLLLRDEDWGTPSMVLFDVHGEYRYLAENIGLDQSEEKSPRLKQDDYFRMQRKVHHYNASFLQIGVPNLSEYDIQRYQPSISFPQLRELRKAIQFCRQKFAGTEIGYDLKDLIFTLNDDPDINPKVKETLVSWLVDLDHMGIFNKYEAPTLKELVKVGELCIVDFSSIVSMRAKQIILHYFTSRMFSARRNSKISPFIIFLEEAHNFIPESGDKGSIAKGIFETLAREGRKFFAQLVLISQRPKHLSTTILSQCNSQIIMRITNPYDLDHIKATSEALTGNSMKIISTLPTGNALLMGAALNYPCFLKVRERLIPNRRSELSLTDICQNFVKKDTFEMYQKSTPNVVQEDFLEYEIDYSQVKE